MGAGIRIEHVPAAHVNTLNFNIFTDRYLSFVSTYIIKFNILETDIQIFGINIQLV